MSSELPKITVAGENSVIVYFSERPCTRTSSLIASTAEQLDIALASKIIDLVPSYTSLLVVYDVTKIDYLTIEKAIYAVVSTSSDKPLTIGKSIELPVYYSLETGPDLQRLADHTKLSIDDVISIHQQTEYTVYAMGFAPGFAYLGETDEKIAMPRLATPRAEVPKGAIGIADRQTAIYPAESPGGWNLIGQCPTAMFKPNQKPSTLVEVGDKVRFKAISRDEFIQLGGIANSAVGKA
ncbi:MAG: Kinase A inhibitor [Cellvibrionales bacterium UBA7375]|nr:allophanate hydrolase [Gammaproteobacteria bacterium]CAI8159328.1 MAG: Kinase A inhibitor [Cellvibrionales bacterium UBA7375]